MIARKSLLVVIAQFFTRILGWVGLVVIAKLWGAFAREALGDIGVAMAFVALFYIISDLGFSQAHVKKISEGQDLGTCIGTFVSIKIILTSIMVFLVLFTLFFLDSILHLGFTDATKQSVVLVFLLYYVLLSIQQIAISTFNGKGEISKMQITAVFENIVKIPLMILVALAGVGLIGLAPVVAWPDVLLPLRQFLAGHPIGSYAMAYVFGMASSVMVGFWLLRKNPLKKPSKKLGKSYFAFTMPILIFSIFSTIATNIDRLLIGFFWTQKEVGDYFSLQQILQIIIIIAVAFNTVLFPVYSEYHSAKNVKKINGTTLLAERYISMVIMPPVVVIIVFAKPLINVMLNSTFVHASPTLIVLTLYAILLSFMAPYYSLLIGMNKPGTYAKIGLGISIINIALDVLFIPQWGVLTPVGINGPTGAAVALVVANVVGYVWVRLSARKLTGIQVVQSHTPRHIGAGVVTGIILYFIGFQSGLFPVVRWFHLILFAMIGLVIYLAVSYLLKEFTKKDLEFFLELINPKKIYHYVTSEIKEENTSEKK